MNGRQSAWIASAVVGIAVLAGLFVAGSPAEQRLLRLDELRQADLVQLSGLINGLHEQSGRLPATLAVLVDGQRLSALPADPESGAAYEYERESDDAYRLCATFARASRADTENFWSHGAGRHCFDFNVLISSRF